MKKSDKTVYKLPHPTGWGSFFTAKLCGKIASTFKTKPLYVSTKTQKRFK